MRRIKKATIDFISLVPAGANRLPVIYKSDGFVDFDTVVKASDDAGELTAVVYAPEHRDSQGDIASAEVIRDMAHSFQKGGGQIDIRHDGKAVSKDRAYVAESYVVQKGDERFADLKDRDGRAVDAAGAWAVLIKIDDPELRRLYREGEWGGVSMAGRAEVVATEKSDDTDEPPGWFTKTLRALGLGGGSQEIDMKKEEIEALLKASQDAIVAALKGDAPATPPAAPTAPTVDMNDPVAVEKHLAGLRAAELRKGVDFTDPVQVEGYLRKLKGEPEVSDDEAGIEKDDSPEVRELKQKLAKARKVSRQAPAAPAEQDDSLADFAKGERDAITRGRAMAAFVNKELLGLKD